ncbi:MAG: alcohol dehydrogenase catalytic domain-containing protein [Planctomycetaceae bacterium]|nr:alcohol dehydrogenase catalytic domain-containing protein [Planctomycetaceae bacterium]
MTTLPNTQIAVQLTGPDTLMLNSAKPVHKPNEWQILGKVEAVGLCFSDLKLLKQFSAHTRKGPIVKGIEQAVLTEIPSYVPNEQPTVPGHETVVRIVAVGKNVKHAKAGDRCLLQTDYRWLPTKGSCAAFGYNFEGALQQYVLMDERVVTAPDGRSMLIRADDGLSAAAIALVEPWACVEDAYVVKERVQLKPGGNLLLAADPQTAAETGGLQELLQKAKPANITVWGSHISIKGSVHKVNSISELPDGSFDDIIYWGGDAATLEVLLKKIANAGLMIIAQCGKRFGRLIDTPVGRVHYGGIRIIGTSGNDPVAALERIPRSGELRAGDKVNVIGAGGPMGVMHVIRNLCQGVKDVTVFAGDLDDGRLAKLSEFAQPLSEKNKVQYVPYNPSKKPLSEHSDYTVIMAPVVKLVAQAVLDAAHRGIINIFAGIAATVSGPIDFDAYCGKQLYFIGTSGSTLDDMLAVLKKVQSGSLDTNISVAAVCGLNGAIDGIRAVEHQTIAGKILVYPDCSLPLTTLDALKKLSPSVASRLSAGIWSKQAEDSLLAEFGMH